MVIVEIIMTEVYVKMDMAALSYCGLFLLGNRLLSPPKRLCFCVHVFVCLSVHLHDYSKTNKCIFVKFSCGQGLTKERDDLTLGKIWIILDPIFFSASSSEMHSSKDHFFFVSGLS